MNRVERWKEEAVKRGAMKQLKASWTVRGGLFPGRDLQPELTKQWLYTSEDYEADIAAIAGETQSLTNEEQRLLVRSGRPMPPTKFETCRKEAATYWETLSDPRRQNWAELTFIWY